MRVSWSSWIGLGVLVLFVLGGIGVLIWAESPNDQDNLDQSELAIETDVPEEDVRILVQYDDPSLIYVIELVHADEKVLLRRSESDVAQWEVQLAVGVFVPARSEKIEGILQELALVESSGGVVRDVSTKELDQFGLDDAQQILLNIELDDGSMQQLRIGDVDFQGVYAYAKNDALEETELALVPVGVRSLLLIDSESIQRGTGEDRVEQ